MEFWSCALVQLVAPVSIGVSSVSRIARAAVRAHCIGACCIVGAVVSAQVKAFVCIGTSSIGITLESCAAYAGVAAQGVSALRVILASWIPTRNEAFVDILASIVHIGITGVPWLALASVVADSVVAKRSVVAGVVAISALVQVGAAHQPASCVARDARAGVGP